ncbi:MAG: hypothetical protein EZS26_000892 [Candidatus Ordinivivax streblomastigis]|uniref:DUF4965 domain-containing protein n=1 Tax=Candidatus Ordinivivax streblomastigis TaxID=2540710 RepID=A0A5M8P3E0_9BACT|nr:MAG: hypothetical protein EZS26_000892 [Candidatus Ordinivivax streblomastigis]
MKQRFLILLAVSGMLLSCSEQHKSDLRAPAYPLITIDPYTSAWAFTDNLYDSSVKHWTGKDFPLLGVIKVDGETYRFMGEEVAEMEVVVPTSEQEEWAGKYTTTKPSSNWMNEKFNDAGWKTANGAFGTISKYTETMAKTDWMDEHIWVRRTVDIPAGLAEKDIYLLYSNDDGAIFYINGVEVFDTGDRCNKNAIVKLSQEAVQALRQGENVLAAYCQNPVANGLLDFGILVAKQQAALFEQTATQKSVDVQATQTHYSFTCGAVDLELTFTAPLLMNDLDLLSRPVNYITYKTISTDGKAHDVELYFEASANWALNTPYQKSVSEAIERDGLIYLKTGSAEQNILAKKGDDVRIDWGYFYLVAEKENTEYATEGKKLALTQKVGTVKNAAGKIMLGYDDIYSIQYFGENLRPYWNRSGEKDIFSVFATANAEYASLLKKCTAFDNQLMADARKAGGKEYAELCALAYRQSIAAHKLVEAPNGDLLFLSKENFSNGSIGTVDITYPSAPLYLLYNPELVKGLMNHIFYYSESGNWTKPFAAHDVGTYPMANGQTYGGDMPVEESGNMLILTAALAVLEGNAAYAEKHWDVLTVWTDYLVKEGLDPENQLCTDDFAGHFAHNANLSVKAILAIASYGHLANMLNKKDVADEYTQKAQEMAQKWIQMADGGDHYRLTFDQADSWSQKYNLVWNKLLKMNIFPEEVAQKELAYYLTKQIEYGLPLDNRKTYTKADWIIWTATMSNDTATFHQFISPLYKFVNETNSRVPMSDWYWADKAEQVGFQARSVVGGYFIKLLEEKMK